MLVFGYGEMHISRYRMMSRYNIVCLLVEELGSWLLVVSHTPLPHPYTPTSSFQLPPEPRAPAHHSRRHRLYWQVDARDQGMDEWLRESTAAAWNCQRMCRRPDWDTYSSQTASTSRVCSRRTSFLSSCATSLGAFVALLRRDTSSSGGAGNTSRLTHRRFDWLVGCFLKTRRDVVLQ